MLCRDDHRIDTDRIAVFIILNRNLCFSVRPQVIDQTFLANPGKALCQLMGQRDGKRHQLRCFIAGIAEHHALVTRSVLFFTGLSCLLLHRAIHTEGDIT